MNLKEAFRYQNKLQLLMNEASSILSNDKNVTVTESTHLRNRVLPEAENETTIEIPESEFSEQINDIMDFLIFLLSEREKLSKSIRETKKSLKIDFDGEVSLNSKRQEIAKLFKHMSEIRASELTLPNAGTGYCFNAEGNQTTFRCPLKKVTTINFSRGKVRAFATELNQKSDAVSTTLDQCLVNTEVEYEQPFDVNSSFTEALEWFCTATNKS